MKVLGDIVIRDGGTLKHNHLRGTISPTIETTLGRNAIENPQPGQFIVTLDDYAINIFDGNTNEWKKLRSLNFELRDRAVLGGSDVSKGVIEHIGIDNLCNSTVFGDLGYYRYAMASCSNAQIGIGLFMGGVGNAWYRGSSWTWTSLIDYCQIAIPTNANMFAHLTYRKYWGAATSNGNRCTAAYVGGYNSTDDSAMQHMYFINMRSRANSTHNANLSTRVRSYLLSATSNMSGDRGIVVSGWNGSINKQNIDYFTISGKTNSVEFGQLISEQVQDTVCVSNGENNRAVIATSYTRNSSSYYIENMESIDISTLSNSSVFGNLQTSHLRGAGVSNRIGNRGVFCGGRIGLDEQEAGVNTNVMEYITITNMSDANTFGELLHAPLSYVGCSNS